MATACPPNPAPPTGYQVWRGKAVPQVLVDWAVRLRDTSMRTAPYGATWPLFYNGETVLARKDHHTWTYRGGELVSDICIPGITLYEPATPAATGTAAAAATTTVDPIASPDPTAALFTEDRRTDWGLVAASAVAAVATVTAFWLALKLAGHAERRA